MFNQALFQRRGGIHPVEAVVAQPRQRGQVVFAKQVKQAVAAKLHNECASFVFEPEIALTAIGSSETLVLRWWSGDGRDNDQTQDRVLSCISPLLDSADSGQADADPAERS